MASPDRSQFNQGSLAQRAPNGERRRGSAGIFPPERPLEDRENPSPADLARADRLHELELEVNDLKEEQRKHKRHDARLVLGTSVLTAGAVIGGQAVYNKVFAAEPTPESIDINSIGPNSFTDTNLEELPPQPEQAEPKRNNYFGFKELPPGRERVEEQSSQNNPSELPLITEYNSIAKFIPEVEVLKFRLEERPPAEKEIKVFTRGLDNPPELKKIIEHYPTFFQIYGYVIGKKLNPDGSVLLSVELPGRQRVFSPDDIDKSMTIVNNIKDDGNEGEISGIVVHLSLPNTGHSRRPLGFYADWRDDFYDSDRMLDNSARGTSSPEEVYNVIRIGDAITAGGATAVSSEELSILAKIYQEDISFDQTIKKYSEVASSNAATIRKIIEDSEKGGLSLRDQTANKSYVLSPSHVTFVPRLPNN